MGVGKASTPTPKGHFWVREPNLIPGRPSHGCVRVRNADMAERYKLTPVETPIEVR